MMKIMPLFFYVFTLTVNPATKKVLFLNLETAVI